jgi:teichuronic acid biosynthesis glycosyltransferase TuaG
MVSIITPLYNSERFIEECLLSVKAQSYTNWEHIIVDDCSIDGSADIILKYAADDLRIKYIKLEKNSGAGIARNTAIKAAKGNYIAFLDSDDIWYPQKLDTQINFMVDNGFHFSFSSYDVVNENGDLTGKTIMAKSIVTYKKALYKNPIGCLTAIYSVYFFGKQYMPSVRKRQDYGLWLSLLKKDNGYGLEESLAKYRITNNSISSNKLSLLKYEWILYRDVEGLSFVKSSFYLLSAIIFKLKSYF